jgi:transcriptional regulator with XRE-family HTH domain
MNALAKYLESNNMTDSAFARYAKLKQPTVWRIKNNKVKRLSANSALRIQEATGGEVTVMELLFPEQYSDKAEL